MSLAVNLGVFWGWILTTGLVKPLYLRELWAAWGSNPEPTD
jgi:hypothetical protein